MFRTPSVVAYTHLVGLVAVMISDERDADFRVRYSQLHSEAQTRVYIFSQGKARKGYSIGTFVLIALLTPSNT